MNQTYKDKQFLKSKNKTLEMNIQAILVKSETHQG